MKFNYKIILIIVLLLLILFFTVLSILKLFGRTQVIIENENNVKIYQNILSDKAKLEQQKLEFDNFLNSLEVFEKQKKECLNSVISLSNSEKITRLEKCIEIINQTKMSINSSVFAYQFPNTITLFETESSYYSNTKQLYSSIESNRIEDINHYKSIIEIQAKDLERYYTLSKIEKKNAVN